MATLFLMVGLPGAGKTTSARSLGAREGALVLTPDEWMIPLFGDSEAEGRRDVLEGRLIRLALDVLRLGPSVVLDFGFWGRDERSALLAIAAASGARAQVVYLPIDSVSQWQRISQRWVATPHVTFPITQAELDAWRELFEEPTAAELVGTWPDPPIGCESWWSWAAQRWPSFGDPAPS
jgi:predicted kinase